LTPTFHVWGGGRSMGVQNSTFLGSRFLKLGFFLPFEDLPQMEHTLVLLELIESVFIFLPPEVPIPTSQKLCRSTRFCNFLVFQPHESPPNDWLCPLPLWRPPLPRPARGVGGGGAPVPRQERHGRRRHRRPRRPPTLPEEVSGRGGGVGWRGGEGWDKIARFQARIFTAPEEGIGQSIPQTTSWGWGPL